jgi:malate synthase
MVPRVTVGRLEVASSLHDFLTQEALPGSGVDASELWEGLESILTRFIPRNRDLLARREELQRRIDEWHLAHPGPITAPAAYLEFLYEIGYLVPEPADFVIGTEDVDEEVATQAGPQLVVPMLNARFAVNAANARWGSLYDALYGTDAVAEEGGKERAGAYNPARGAEVIARGRAFLDECFPLATGSHADARAYAVEEGGLTVRLEGSSSGLRDRGQYVGYRGDPEAPEAVLLVHHGLHVEIQVDRDDPIGSGDAAGVRDLLVEAAVSTIMDLEDSVAAVDAEDKVTAYRNWLLLNRGTLSAEVTKDGRTFTRRLAEDRRYHGPAGEVVLPGRSLLFVRQVGHLMTSDLILIDGDEVPEGILDGVVTALCSLVDIQGRSELRSSRTGSMYAVKPKMHGPDEVRFTDDLFAAVEDLLSLRRGTIKLGIMDEERRTSANLKACILAARDRVAFINTGFLDRTGDELHTSMRGGPMIRKGEMKSSRWILAYEDQNVDIGLACGFQGTAQIGKGMWAMPDEMAAMLAEKAGHPRAGASCAWVPSPTAATLHALHYHQVDVAARQRELADAQRARGPRTDLEQLLTVPFAPSPDWTDEERTAEIENNLQGVLGYVKRWVDEGIGCSKVPDIRGTALMEDRATCRISSQHVANWLAHGVVTAEEVEAAFRRMAAVVDEQQGGDPGYEPMGPAYDGEAFRAAHALVFEGLSQPSGYTEPILHAHRRARKARGGSV